MNIAGGSSSSNNDLVLLFNIMSGAVNPVTPDSDYVEILGPMSSILLAHTSDPEFPEYRSTLAPPLGGVVFTFHSRIGQPIRLGSAGAIQSLQKNSVQFKCR